MEKTVVVNATRCRVVREEGCEHPWETHEQACALICWGDDYDHGFGTEDDREDRPDEIKAIMNADDVPQALVDWVKDKAPPFFVLGIRCDKYGFMQAVDYNSEFFRSCDGCLVITKEMYLKHYDEANMTTSQMEGRMKEVAYAEAQMLVSWYGGEVYGYIIEEDIIEHAPFESSVNEVDACWGFFNLDNSKKLYERMFDQFNDESDIRKALFDKLMA